ncbi:hypothetical protein GCM10011360_02220 [Primorskyibacter flagellatus]|uniref:VPLPA-CTERM protein sorting domain-containing protein n=1 Tax=Primorskyibacter flagellatus TaxID=1387277 RepID=A0A916ZX05_9RHOB|nr:LamG-like jellyroll fold domain-containing protein [Primorskyibacter flagellatus]GGE16983.1 hypothetical protein GCM10011360_02220 [Primorskyibacter flagellatus]
MFLKTLAIAGLATFAAAGAASASTLIHYYGFDDDSVTDTVGSVDGALFGDAVVEDGFLKLDGQGDYAQLSDHAVPLGSQTVILSFQRLSKPHTYGEIISQGSSGNGYYIGYQGSDTFRFGDNHLSTSVAYPADGEFHQFAMVTGPGLSFYIDGVLVYTSGSVAANTHSGTPTRFGVQFNTGGGSPYVEYVHGNLDYVAIFEGALTAEEIRAFGSAPAVPLPASLPLLAFGVAGLAALRRRRG